MTPGQDANLALALITATETAIWRLPVKTDSPAWPYIQQRQRRPEFSELITDFTPESSASLYTKSVRVTQDKKAVYAIIANYAGQSFTAAGQPVTITEQTPRSVLDALQVFRDCGQRYRHGIGKR